MVPEPSGPSKTNRAHYFGMEKFRKHVINAEWSDSALKMLEVSVLKTSFNKQKWSYEWLATGPKLTPVTSVGEVEPNKTFSTSPKLEFILKTDSPKCSKNSPEACRVGGEVC